MEVLVLATGSLDLTDDGMTDILAFTERGVRVFAAKSDSFVDDSIRRSMPISTLVSKAGPGMEA